MKGYACSIDENFKKLFFPHNRIKTKTQIIEILMESCRYILLNDSQTADCKNKLVLKVEKMSRLFFIDEKKYYSINFPFTFYCDDTSKSINYKGLLNVDSRLISDILAIIKDPRFNSENYFDFADSFEEIDDYYLGRIWVLLKDLLTYEDGYLRIDYDTELYLKAKEEGREHSHPENHIDIFYTNSNTFKVGLNKNVDHDFFIDLLNTKTDCFYLKH